MPNTQQVLNFSVARSIVDNCWVIVSKRDGGVMDGAETETDAHALCAQMNADDES